MTASGLADRENEAREAGADAFVRKPYREGELLAAIGQKLTGEPFASLSEERFPVAAAGAAAVARGGGLVGMGAHGEVPGPGFHWEMEAHVMGGMTPMEALHAATAGSAETIGRLDDLGTLERTEPVGEDRTRDPRQAALELVEPARTTKHLAHDQERPTVAEDLARLGDRAVLRVAPHLR